MPLQCKMRFWLSLPMLVPIVAACDSYVHTPERLVAPADIDRKFSSTAFDTVWVLGGPTDTLLASPAMIRPYGDGGLVFFDHQNRKIYRIGPGGQILWSWGQQGEGPGEINDVRGLDVRDDGSIILTDAGNQRIFTLGTDGDLVAEHRLMGRMLHSASGIADNAVAIHGRVPPLGVWNATSGVRDVKLPAEFSDLVFLQYQGRTAAWRDARWVFGLSFGNGWMVLDDTTIIDIYPYVEHTDFPVVQHTRKGLSRITQMVTRPVSSGRSLSVRGDTLYVLFGGAKYSGRILDKYNLNTGKYLATDILPHYANRAVVGKHGRVFTVMTADLFPVITAITPQE